MALSEADRAALLADLGFHWGDAYEVDTDGQTYSAWRRGFPETVLTAETERELRALVRRDYFAWCATLKERSST